MYNTRRFRYLLIVLGTLSAALGLLGVLLPLLPTTPLLLLAAACYARSSRRFYLWLTTNRLFGSYIRDYREGRGIPALQRAITIVFLWLTISVTGVFFINAWWLRGLLLGVALGVTIHLVRMRTQGTEGE